MKITSIKMAKRLFILISIFLLIEIKCSNSQRIPGLFQFSKELLKVGFQNKESDNLVCSPLGVNIILSMLNYGAKDGTREELNSVLHIPKTYSPYYKEFRNFKNIKNSHVELRFANRIYVSNKCTVNDNYRRVMNLYFKSPPKAVAFSEDSSNKILNEINNWCSKSTNGRIERILEPGMIDSKTLMVLLSAIYFKGKWQDQFNKGQTDMQPFFTKPKTSKMVPMMHAKRRMKYGEISNLGIRFVELHYAQENHHADKMSMFVLLPTTGNNFESMVNNLDKIQLSDLSKSEIIHVTLSLPKLKLKNNIDLRTYMEQMNVSTIFNSPNFDNMLNDCKMVVDRFIQKVFLEINEEGSEAAAVTAVVSRVYAIRREAPPMSEDFNVNEPFVLFIVSNGDILFGAKVTDPQV